MFFEPQDKTVGDDRHQHHVFERTSLELRCHNVCSDWLIRNLHRQTWRNKTGSSRRRYVGRCELDVRPTLNVSRLPPTVADSIYTTRRDEAVLLRRVWRCEPSRTRHDTHTTSCFSRDRNLMNLLGWRKHVRKQTTRKIEKTHKNNYLEKQVIKLSNRWKTTSYMLTSVNKLLIYRTQIRTKNWISFKSVQKYKLICLEKTLTV